MKKSFFFFASFFCLISAFSQQATVTWGDEFKLHKGSTDLAVIYSDKSGVYLKETHETRSFFEVKPREAATLVKLDGALTQIYTNDFNKELKGKEFEQFFILQDKFFILASDYNKKEKTMTLYGAEVDKSTGNLAGDWQEITNWQKDEKGDDIDFKVSANADSTKMVIVSSVEGKEKNTYEIRQFDKTLKATDKPIVISNEFDPKTFQLEDVLYTVNEKVVLVGRVYEYEDGKKKKAKFLDFKNYNIRIYDNSGAIIKEINTDIAGKWLVSTKVVQEKDKDLVLAAFYSNEKKGKEINGLLVERINPNTGDVITNSQKEINTSLITVPEEDNGDADDDDKKQKKEDEKLAKIQDDAEGFSRYMQFRNIFYTADNGLVILAEKYHHYEQTVSNMNTGGFGGGIGGIGSSTTTTYSIYECGDLMMSKMDSAGNITWLEILPKSQRETIEISSSSSFGSGFSFSMGDDYFNSRNLPFYAGFGAIAAANTINILFNDNEKNENVLHLGQKVKTINNFHKSDCFQVTLDALTGKYVRSSLFDNREQPTAMPRLGSAIGKDMYVIGKNDKTLGKSKIAVAKISVK